MKTLTLRKSLLAACFGAFLSINATAQNPTVINDSLIVNQRIYAKEKLIVDLEAKFKDDIKVLGTARLQGNLVVSGVATFENNVKMTGLGSISSLSATDEIVIILPNGQLKKGTVGMMVSAAYQPFGCPPGDVPSPTWMNGLNKIFTPCPPVKVGIGTTTPTFKLHVVGDTYTEKLVAGNINGYTSAILNATGTSSSTTDLLQLNQLSTGTTDHLRLRVTSAGTLMLYCEGANALIAHNSDGSKILQLENSGLLRAREIRVDEDEWPDYVFASSYKLPKLKDVADYIDKNKHLPGVPSAAEIQTAGLNLGDMQKIQMQKIEELTLYMIELDKKIATLEARVAELEN